MQITGIVCEYNPLHLGHQRQLDAVRAQTGPDSGIVCLMSGNYVQRGAPAIVDKSLRAKAAILAGADLVLELPVTAALSSAEGFAAQAVAILGKFCQRLCFGAETPDPAALSAAAEALLSPAFPPALHAALARGSSFPAARQQALESMGIDGGILNQPNNILAVEYCKAILAQNSPMAPMPIPRPAGYHDSAAGPDNPSAAAVRLRMERGEPWLDYVPTEARACLAGGALHTLAAGERAILARLRSMSEAEFAEVPYGSEGLWHKLMRSARQEASLEDIFAAVKSKRYTRTRLSRMVLCAFLGLTAREMAAPAPYVRVLAFRRRGRQILKAARDTGVFLNAGEKSELPYQRLESRTEALYGLFAVDGPEAPGLDAHRRVFSLEQPL